MELQVIWARKATGASVLFIMNRYVCLVVQALEMICQFADISCTVCVIQYAGAPSLTSPFKYSI